jgi:hypothetical protein
MSTLNPKVFIGTQRHRRFEFSGEGFLIHNGHRVGFNILNVSALGMKAVLSDPIEIGETYALKINIDCFHDTEIIARAVWDNHENMAGFEVLNNCDLWKRFIARLEAQVA